MKDPTCLTERDILIFEKSSLSLPSIHKLQILKCRNCQEFPAPLPNVIEWSPQKCLHVAPFSIVLNSTRQDSKCSIEYCSSGRHPTQASVWMAMSPRSRKPRCFSENTVTAQNRPLFAKTSSCEVFAGSPTHVQHGSTSPEHALTSSNY